MEPSAKKRRLAPKIDSQSAHTQFTHDQPPVPPHYPPVPQSLSTTQTTPASDGTSNPQRNDFESFARHLQDAAMMIYSQSNSSSYEHVSVLLMRWDEDITVESDMVALENVFRERYNYKTERFNIPTVANPSIKLGVRVASYLENARPDHLLIIYYAGHGYMGPENQLYWACNPREDAAKIKWNGIRCLFEDAQSDILLLLDTCAIQDAPVDGSHGTKQALAACAYDRNPRDPSFRSFTTHLVEALLKLLGASRPFPVLKLFEELTAQKQQEISQSSRLTNGSLKSPASETVPMPISFPLTPAKSHSITLAPLRSKAIKFSGLEGDASSSQAEVSLGAAVSDLMFDEPHALVCTTFVGDASPDMSSFNQWLHTSPTIANKIKVQGMFVGPPTILIISMPQSVWDVVQSEKVCLFLGYISTHNITHLYQKVMNSVTKEVEDGRILLEARQAAAAHRNPAETLTTLPNTPRQLNLTGHADSVSRVLSGTLAAAADGKNEVEDSAEMQEAAEQLKALSHVRHLSDGSSATVERSLARLVDSTIEPRQDNNSSHELAGDEAHYSTIDSMTASKQQQLKPRRTLLKQRPSQDTRCGMCSHAPFKDSSSLRKHIAAAHTRPFPCAFSFAGCMSTFGSKNEWKRHIASQHLCLQYYRCLSCPQNTAEGKGNEFNRKDLFTQHLRRMHAPFAIKKSLAKSDSKLQADWESHVKDMQAKCLMMRRQPPQKSACPKKGCQSTFEGPGSWDEWTEHVGRHMEKGDGQDFEIDGLLAQWALDESIIERRSDGTFRLCSGSGIGEREPPNHIVGSHSDSGLSHQYPEAKDVAPQLNSNHTDDSMPID